MFLQTRCNLKAKHNPFHSATTLHPPATIVFFQVALLTFLANSIVDCWTQDFTSIALISWEQPTQPNKNTNLLV